MTPISTTPYRNFLSLLAALNNLDCDWDKNPCSIKVTFDDETDLKLALQELVTQGFAKFSVNQLTLIVTV